MLTNYRVRYRFFDNSIILPAKINSSIIVLFASAINEWLRRQQYNPLNLNFTNVQKAYSNGMLPIISTVFSLRTEGYIINVSMPESPEVFTLFRLTNWA